MPVRLERDGETCRQYCRPQATFSAQADALAGVDTLEAYTEWMKDLLIPVPDGHYEVRSFAVDDDRNNVAAYGVFRGTHTGRVDLCLRRESEWRRTMSTSWSSRAT